MGSLNIIRIIVQVFATIIAMIGIGFITAAVLSSGWQIMIEPGTGEIHQHGLWMDYVLASRSHMAGAANPIASVGAFDIPYGYQGYNALSPSYYSGYGGYGGYGTVNGQWIMTYKFGDAVYGDEVHRAQPYQVYALVLLVVALLFSLAGLFLGYCASMKVGIAIACPVLFFVALILGAAGLIQFYVASMLPEYRFSYTDRRLQQFVGYSYWWAVVGIVAVGLTMMASIAVAVLLSLMTRRGEKAERAALVFRREYQTRV